MLTPYTRSRWRDPVYNAAQRGLEAGTTPQGVLATVKQIAVSFGTSNPEQARTVGRSAEAIVNQIAAQGKSAYLVPKVEKFVGELVKAVR